MKILSFIPVSFLLVSSLLAQPPEKPSSSELSKLRQGYVDSLNHLLQQYVKDHDIAAAATVSVELDKMAGDVPNSAPDMSPCGAWTWIGHGRTTITADQMATNNGGNKGIWHWVDEAKHIFQIEWQDGFVDTVTISPDGTKAYSVNNLDVKFAIERLPSSGKRITSPATK